MRVAVGMSGGVDSSVSALLMKLAGYEVIGVTLRFHTLPESCSVDDLRVCCSPQDVKDAVRVSEKLGIPHITLDWERIFKNRVIDYFVKEYLEGKTPNPCAVCNRDVKTGFLAKYLREVVQIDKLATGHYAKILEYKERKMVGKAQDKNKDQSYFLALVERDVLELLEFPIGSYTKDQVRRIAQEYNLPVAQKRDSQEVCFLMGKKPGEFLRDLVGLKEGVMTDTEGKVLGRHTGIYNFTIGQRRGLRVSAGKPLYVIDVDWQNNRLIVGEEDKLYRDGLKLLYLNTHLPIKEWEDVYAVVRYRSKPVRVKDIRETQDGSYLVEFEEKVWGITPGQVCAFYKEDMLLGGGVIAKE